MSESNDLISTSLRVKRPCEAISDDSFRSKRSRYVPSACNECKRRKLKCDGQKPCQRCVKRSVNCSYRFAQSQEDAVVASSSMPDSGQKNLRLDSWDQKLQQMNMQLENVMNKVESISRILCTNWQDKPPLVTAQELDSSHADINLTYQVPQARICNESNKPVPRHCELTSSESAFRVANRRLSQMGIDCWVPLLSFDGKHGTVAQSPRADATLLKKATARDPLWHLTRLDVLRYMSLYGNGVGSMYPVINFQDLVQKANEIFNSFDALEMNDFKEPHAPVVEILRDPDTNKIKLITAIGLIMEVGIRSVYAARLIRSIDESSDTPLINAQGIDGIQILVLTALFHYHMDEEIKASKLICLASRLCLEMGLHKRETIVKNFKDEDSMVQALSIFWSVVMLDRRSSLGLGVPFVIQDGLIDPKLYSMPIDHTYLHTMIHYTKLTGKAYYMSSEFYSKNPEQALEEIQYLDFQVKQWREKTPRCLLFNPEDVDKFESSDTRAQTQLYLSVVLLVRTNQLRSLLYRPILQSTSLITNNHDHVLNAIAIARESIQTLCNLRTQTNLLEYHATFFKHFIISALGNLLLIAVHGTAEFWTEIRETFMMALDLLKQLSARSEPVSRIWDRLKGLEELQTKILRVQRENSDVTENESCFAEPSWLDNQWSEAPVPFPGHEDTSANEGASTEFLLFDSQIRDEFASFFDASVQL